MKKKLIALLAALSLILSLAACGGNADSTTGGSQGEEAPAKEINLSEFHDTLLSEREWPELMAVEGEILDTFYPGLSEISTKQCLIYTAAITSIACELALVETENAEDVQKVEELFQARVDYQVGDDTAPGGAWYPETIEGWKNNSHIVSNGNYVMLAVGDSAADAVLRFGELFE